MAHSEETRQKLREARLRNISAGKIGGMSGRQHSPESIAKLRTAATGKQYAERPWYVGAKLCHIKNNAKCRDIEWCLSDTEAKDLIEADCRYCGATTQRVTCKKNWGLTNVNGIDRLDSSQGYTLENCVTACHTCNVAKAQMSIDDFFAWIKRVYSRLPQG